MDLHHRDLQERSVRDDRAVGEAEAGGVRDTAWHDD
jgi:hypothetical protein